MAPNSSGGFSTALKITTPIQLGALIVVAILQITQNGTSILSIISVAILGGLVVLVMIFMYFSKKIENQFLIESGIERLRILIEWITEFRQRVTNNDVCGQLDIRLQELRASLNYLLQRRSN